jgi:hypothetical protein
MAQMPIQLLAGRVNYNAPPANPTPLLKAGATIPHNAYVFDPGGISGGLLRPGAMDQSQFKNALAEAQKQAVTAPPAPVTAGVPNLSPAQFAALGAVEQPAGSEMVIDIPGPAPSQSGTPDSSGAGGGTAIGPSANTGANASPAAPGINPLFSTAPVSAPADAPVNAPTDAAPGDAAPAASDVAPDAKALAPQAHASTERGPIPGSRCGADGVWELTRLPDKDERQMLIGQKWRVVESEASRKLFLGPDGKFGWDDFVDLINPLQHIPFVNIAYRAITGDQIYGAARLVDFALGPVAGVSTAADLAVKSVTGKSMAENGIAMLFGTGDEAGDVASINTAAGSATQLADASLTRRGSNE